MPDAPSDPFAAWKQAQTAWTKAWSEAMNDVVNSDDFAQTLGDSVGATMETLRHAQRQAAALGAPDPDVLARLGARLTRIEMRLDDLDAKVDDLATTVGTLDAKLDAVLAALDRLAEATSDV